MKKTLSVILSVILIMTFAITSLGAASIAVKSIKLNSSNIKLQVGKTSTLKVTFTPANATNKKLTYSSGNKKIATVDNNGKIKGIKAGKTVITVTSSSNKKAVAKCNVTISQAGITNEKITLRIGWWGSQERHNATLKVIEMFSQKYPNISFEAEYAGWGGYWDKIVAQAAGNNLPDVFQQDLEYLLPYAQKGILEPLNEYISDKRLDLSSVDEKQIQGGKVDGKLYGISLGTNAYCTIYDPVMFEKADVPLPSVDWTWDDFEKYATKLHDVLGVFGVADIPGKFDGYVRQFGKSLFSKDAPTLGYEDDNIFISHFERILRLQKAGVLPTPEQSQEITAEEDNFLVRGKAAMLGDYSNLLVANSTAAKRPLGIALIPNGDPGSVPGLYLKPSMFFSIAAGSKYKNESAKFIEFFTIDVEANKVLNADRGVPISSTVRKAMLPLLGDAQKKTFDYIGEVEKHSREIDPADPPGASEAYDAFRVISDEILFGKITPAEGAAKFRLQANDALAKAAIK